MTTTTTTTTAPTEDILASTREVDATDAPASSSSSASPATQVSLDRDSRRQWRNTLSYLSSMGSTQTRGSVWKPAHTRLKPPSPREVTISHLLAATAHVGHSTANLSKAYQPWVYGTRHGVAQIDVEKATLPSLRRASKVVREVVLRDGVVLIVGTHKETQRAVVAATKRMGPNGFHVTVERWMPGILTNSPSLLSRAIMGSLSDYESGFEVQQQGKEDARAARRSDNRDSRDSRRDNTPSPPSVAKLASQLLQPDLLIVLNPKLNLNAIREATTNSIPTIGIVDTDVDPRIVTYPIPANDESVRVQELIVGVLSKAGEEGRTERLRLIELDERAGKKEKRGRRREEQQQQH